MEICNYKKIGIRMLDIAERTHFCFFLSCQLLICAFSRLILHRSDSKQLQTVEKTLLACLNTILVNEIITQAYISNFYIHTRMYICTFNEDESVTSAR